MLKSCKETQFKDDFATIVGKNKKSIKNSNTKSTKDDSYDQRQRHSQKKGSDSKDWQCPKCNTNNFRHRNQCFKCKENKPNIDEINSHSHGEPMNVDKVFF